VTRGRAAGLAALLVHVGIILALRGELQHRSIALAAAVLLKVSPALLVAYLALRGEWRLVGHVAAAGLLLVASLAAAQTATVLTGPFEEALAQAQKQNKLILIDFYSSG